MSQSISLDIPPDFNSFSEKQLKEFEAQIAFLKRQKQQAFINSIGVLNYNLEDVKKTVQYYKDTELPKGAEKYLIWRIYQYKDIEFFNYVMSDFPLKPQEKKDIEYRFISSSLKDKALYEYVKDHYPEKQKKIILEEFHTNGLNEILPELFFPILKEFELKIKKEHIKHYLSNEGFPIFKEIMSYPGFEKTIGHEENIKQMAKMAFKASFYKSTFFLIEKFNLDKNINSYLSNIQEIRNLIVSDKDFLHYVLNDFQFDNKFLEDFIPVMSNSNNYMKSTKDSEEKEYYQTAWKNVIKAIVDNPNTDLKLTNHLAALIDKHTPAHIRQSCSTYLNFYILGKTLKEKDKQNYTIKI